METNTQQLHIPVATSSIAIATATSSAAMTATAPETAIESTPPSAAHLEAGHVGPLGQHLQLPAPQLAAVQQQSVLHCIYLQELYVCIALHSSKHSLSMPIQGIVTSRFISSHTLCTFLLLGSTFS